MNHPVAAVFLDCGMGKTAITLSAINKLDVHKILVIAPLRVCLSTWPAEIEKWDHLKHLTYAVAVGTEKQRLEALDRQADIYIINRENLPWFVENTMFDYDMVVIDELSSFKNHKSERFKALMKVRHKIKRIAVQAVMVLWICMQSLKYWIWDNALADS